MEKTIKQKKSHKKGLLVFLVIMFIIVLLATIFVGMMGWKLSHLISPEIVQEVMETYRSYTVGPQTIDSVQDLGVITSINQADYSRGPISITPAKLNGEEITLVTLGGTQTTRENQATTMTESKLASDDKSNDYLVNVVKLFENDTVPKGKPVMITGISLGGMIAQQLIGQKAVTDNYEIKAIVTFGSPVTMPFDRNGIKVVRFVDSNDIVPKLGEKFGKFKKDNRIPALHETERVLLTGSHKDGIETHALSYIKDPVWNEYDFLGVKGGTNKLELLAEMTFYENPKLS